MKVSWDLFNKVIKKDTPGFWADRTFNKTLEEYKEMYNAETPEKDTIDDFSFLSMLIFQHEYGIENIQGAMVYLRSISKNNTEGILRTAHFFEQLGRKRERSLFK